MLTCSQAAVLELTGRALAAAREDAKDVPYVRLQLLEDIHEDC
ncbi:hypothetical protein fHeYen301_20 [Yersinia phage fHe-Yen3-01]|uniref:Uncharacterized protein n=1 Tax=Yersinia phage fHe-Yen3-01 TaxID=1932893 RepID=A0A1L7DQM9_9CAUD|nr:hypothetical protein HOR56_gp20 [Yersinia phage fHe-Yen3-01]APU00353.1 hypothetical protein fHeYen301_20 [Yersinia phage fHe-Yen3-01]